MTVLLALVTLLLAVGSGAATAAAARPDATPVAAAAAPVTPAAAADQGDASEPVGDDDSGAPAEQPQPEQQPIVPAPQEPAADTSGDVPATDSGTTGDVPAETAPGTDTPVDPATETPPTDPADPGTTPPTDPTDPGTPPTDPGTPPTDPGTAPPTDPVVETPPPVVETPAETPPPAEPVVDPAPAPDPAPADPAPAEKPAEETPADDRPVARDTRPQPSDSTPKPSDGAPKPSGSGTLRASLVDSAAPSTPAAPAAPAVQDGSAVPASVAPIVGPTAPLPGSRDDPAVQDSQSAAARDAATKRIVRKALVELGIVPATPATAAVPQSSSAPAGVLCAPVVVTAVTPSPVAGATRVQVVKSERRQRGENAPSTVRGPPASPFDSPSSPLTSSAAAAPGSGSVAGISFFAILVGSVSAQLAQAETVAPPCSYASNSATPTSDDSARAPPAI